MRAGRRWVPRVEPPQGPRSTHCNEFDCPARRTHCATNGIIRSSDPFLDQWRSSSFVVTTSGRRSVRCHLFAGVRVDAGAAQVNFTMDVALAHHECRFLRAR